MAELLIFQGNERRWILMEVLIRVNFRWLQEAMLQAETS